MSTELGYLQTVNHLVMLAMAKQKPEEIEQMIQEARDPINSPITINVRKSTYQKWYLINEKLKARSRGTKVTDYARVRIEELLEELSEFLAGREEMENNNPGGPSGDLGMEPR